MGSHTSPNVKHTISAVFPGQASQYVGMSRTLTDQFPWTVQIYEEASDAIKENVLKLCAEGPEDALQLTKNQQPCILTTSYAWFQVLKKTLDFSPFSAGGHSLGEYSALLASGAMSLSEAVRLVRVRGELMQNAVPQGKGKMAAVLGLSDDKVKELCEKASEKGSGSLVVPANFNAPSQVVIAGHAEAVDRAQSIASDPNAGELKARKVVPLNVSAPFHSPLMKPVAEKFTSHLQTIQWKQRAFPVVHNVDAQIREEGDLVGLLTQQLDHPVLWTSCVSSLVGHGTTAFVEMGPNKVLTGLIKRIADNVKLFSMDSIDDLKKFETYLKEGQS
ncbi:MAG: ACP S-malonyltransferase [Deltaproteobacteria bacterium]